MGDRGRKCDEAATLRGNENPPTEAEGRAAILPPARAGIGRLVDYRPAYGFGIVALGTALALGMVIHDHHWREAAMLVEVLAWIIPWFWATND